jgi:hypothetical protein
MSIPSHIKPPFNIVRASHVLLTVTDLASSRAFYEGQSASMSRKWHMTRFTCEVSTNGNIIRWS